MTKIDIISGFLGAGKTTFIKKMLKEAFSGEQVVLIENEFGEIGIDGGFLKEAGIEIREMNSGCICCSLVGDFGKSLKEVVDTYHPDRILIEPSGVGKLSDVIKAVQDVQDEIEAELNSFTTVVDVTKCRLYKKNFGEFFSNQIEYAGTVILSRTDTPKATDDKVQTAVELIRSLNENAAVITTPVEQLSGEKILDTMEHNRSLEKELMEEEVCPVCGGHHHEGHDHHHHDHEECGCGHDHDEHDHHHDHDEECHAHHHDHDEECHEHHHGHDEECHEHHHHDHDEECHGHHHHDGCGHEHHHHHADEVFTSWGMETIVPVTHEQLEDVLKRLSNTREFGDVLRAKGMLPTENPGEWLYFDLVPEQYEIRQGRPDYTGKVCVIGASLKEEELNSVFGRG